MPHASVNGVSLYYETAGEGAPVIFSHEFGGDYRAWEPQLRFFARYYRCTAYSHRGFPPSSAPERLEDYSQDLLIEDLRGLVRELGVKRAHFVGCSMGAQTVLMFACRYPELCQSIVVVGAGSGSTDPAEWRNEIDGVVETLRSGGVQAFADGYSGGRSRLPFKHKDPRGWEEFRRQLAEHSAVGQALTMQGVQRARRTVLELSDELRQLRVPALIMVGDEDDGCIEPALFMKRQIPSAQLTMFPGSGHTLNTEEPDLFNQVVLRYLHAVERDSPMLRGEG